METQNVRNIILRALFEPNFHHLLLTNPDAALKDYNLTEKESEILKNPSRDLYQYLAPSREAILRLPGLFGGAGDPGGPQSPVTVIVIIIVAIIIFVALTESPGAKTSLEAYGPLLKAIQNSSGAARMDLVKTLISELTKEG